MAQLMIEGETKAIRISQPRPRQPIEVFAMNTQNYDEKEGDTFGEKIDYSVKQAVKRVYQETHEEEDYDEKKRLISLADPKRYLFQYPAILCYLKHETKRRRYKEDPKPKDYEVRPWNVLHVMVDYVRHNIVAPSSGRRKNLVLTGTSKTRKIE
jgi:hypothetical protein